jgi:hypothetical protein
MANQPEVNKTRQSAPPAKPAPHKGTLHDLKPGGPIMPAKQGYENPGVTPNLRGVEPNTAMHKGTPNPQQEGSHGPIGDYVHDPGKGDADNHYGHGIPTPTVPLTEKHSVKGKPINVRQVAPGHFARHDGEVHG